MLSGNRSILYLSMFIFGAFILLITLSTPTTVHADDPYPAENGNCITCHENLYFLHDTGNWFCLKESPMACVDCHEGDPAATTAELAHANRATHPVMNEDISKCQECHANECNERVALFDQTAGISQVRVAAPYTPMEAVEDTSTLHVDASQQKEEPGILLMIWEVIPLVIIAGLALTISLLARWGHN